MPYVGQTITDVFPTSINVDTATIATANISNQLTDANMSAGSVLQVQVGSINDIYSSTSTSFADVTGFNVSITPTSSSSTILVSFSTVAGNTQPSRPSRFRVIRTISGGSAVHVGVGATDGDSFSGTRTVYDNVAETAHQVHWQGVDSPSTTSATVYKIMAATGGGTLKVNNRHNDDMSQTSTITVMEIAG